MRNTVWQSKLQHSGIVNDRDVNVNFCKRIAHTTDMAQYTTPGQTHICYYSNTDRSRETLTT